MWLSDLEQPLLILFLLALSAFASSSETAFFSLNRFQIKRIREFHKGGYERLQRLLSRPSRLIVLIVLLNEVVNLSISSLIANFLETNLKTIFENIPFLDTATIDVILGKEYRWLISSVLSMSIAVPLLLIFGEITPKIVASKLNQIVAIINSRFLIYLYRLLFPILWVLDSVIGFCFRRMQGSTSSVGAKIAVLSEDDFVALMEEGHREQALEAEEKEMIENVLEFDDSTVADAMLPIQKTFCLNGSSTLKDSLPQIRANRTSRIPVYGKNKFQILGILYVKDLIERLHDPLLREAPLSSLTSPAMSVHPDVRLSSLLKKFQREKTHIAICMNRNNEAVGVITMDDLLESIYGETTSQGAKT